MALISDKQLQSYYDNISNYINHIINTTDINGKKRIMNELYLYIKQILRENKNNRDLMSSLRILCQRIYEAEAALFLTCKPKDRFILDPFFELNDSNNFQISDSPIDLLNYIVCRARKELFTQSSLKFISNDEYHYLNLANYCGFASDLIKTICDELDIECQIITFGPYMLDPYCASNYNGIHYFNIVKIDGSEYLIDITYSQFFLLSENLLNRIGIIDIPGCKPGIFMIQNPDRLSVSKKILSDGWIPLTDSVVKSYMDGFALTLLNGLYYEKTGDFSLTTGITAGQYRKYFETGKTIPTNIDPAHLCFQEKMGINLDLESMIKPQLK